jgi:DNA-binding NarL/FixJ family response regulator
MKSESSSAKSKTKILIVDDHPIVREGLIRLIQRQGDLEVCAEAETAVDTLRLIRQHQPDLVIVDLALKDRNGLDLIKDLKSQFAKLPTLMLSMHDESLYAERALRAGARGYVMKQEATETVILAIRRVLAGQIYLSENISSRLLGALVSGTDSGTGSSYDRLSDRELEVFELIGQGLGTRQIAEKLHLSIKTIEAYREHIKEKLKLQNASELTLHAFHWVNNLKSE